MTARKPKAKPAKPATTPAGRPANDLSHLPDPSPRLKGRLAVAEEWLEERRADVGPLVRVMIDKGKKVGSPHKDETGWVAHLCMTFGTISTDFAAAVINALENAPGHSASDPVQRDHAVASGIAFLASQKPQNEMEALLLVQMWGTSRLVLQNQQRAGRAELIPQCESYITMATKLGRLYVEQAQALAKLKTGGKQQVEVRYVYVDARSQTVVNAPGVGGQSESDGRPHAKALAYAPGSPVWGQDPGRNALPVAGDQGPQQMPDAWGAEPWRAGDAERELSQRSAHPRDDRAEG